MDQGIHGLPWISESVLIEGAVGNKELFTHFLRSLNVFGSFGAVVMGLRKCMPPFYFYLSSNHQSTLIGPVLAMKSSGCLKLE